MKRGFKFEYLTCPYCEQFVAINWFIRHIKKYHPETIEPKPLMTDKEMKAARLEANIKAGAYF